MDWDKAKKYLIISLVVLNIALILSIVSHNNVVSIDNIYFSKKSLADLQTVLDRKNIKITTEIPKDIYNLGTINVEYDTINDSNYPILFDAYENQITVNVLKKLVLKEPGLVIDNSADAENFAFRFISKYLNGLEYSLRNFTSEDGVITLYFNPVYDGYIFEESFLRFEFSQDGMKIVMIAMKPLDVSATKREAITSVEAILKAFPSMDRNTIISKIDFIYYFGTNFAEDLYKVKNARAFPCWRLMTSENKFYYVPALEN
ncbi:MAG: two-component system regulatory protein YycI [Proteocatella sp.]